MRNFDEYIRQGEPSQKEKALIWQTAIGLQDVDGLKRLIISLKRHEKISKIKSRLTKFSKGLTVTTNNNQIRKTLIQSVPKRQTRFQPALLKFCQTTPFRFHR